MDLSPDLDPMLAEVCEFLAKRQRPAWFHQQARVQKGARVTCCRLSTMPILIAARTIVTTEGPDACQSLVICFPFFAPLTSRASWLWQILGGRAFRTEFSRPKPLYLLADVDQVWTDPARLDSEEFGKAPQELIGNASSLEETIAEFRCIKVNETQIHNAVVARIKLRQPHPLKQSQPPRAVHDREIVDRKTVWAGDSAKQPVQSLKIRDCNDQYSGRRQ